MADKSKTDRIKPLGEVDAEGDQFAQQEATEHKNEGRANKKKRDLDYESREFDLDAKKTYAIAVFVLVAVWILLVLILVTWAGHKDLNLDIADGVLIALITGLSVNVVGLLAIVTSYLFPKKSD